MPCCFVHTLPLFWFVQWYAYNASLCHLLAFCASLHTCLHVHAWVLLVSVSSMLQHNEVMDIRSKPTFIPRKHHLLFAFACLSPFLSFVCMIPHSCVCHFCHAYCFMPFLYALCIFPFLLLVCWFLVFAFACAHVERGRMELGHGLPSASKKGANVSM